ncbi:conserved membrane hypothetical protein [uncultured Alphaproteobacteria bacterium]|uniref:diguanylate cyclase n=1 Tax=uncultured Alphaproteobacteria bacterium TaxID=91750 RepID=A0A212K649_9PROT|nr:conserved membrane hypothetical protein [uncultured Alphaproteobacteria bacterium]
MDSKTLIVVLSLLIALNAAILLLLNRLHGEMPGPRDWACGAACITVGVMVATQHGGRFAFAAVAAGNWLVVAGYALIFIGVQRFCGLHPRAGTVLLIASLTVAPVLAMPDPDGDAVARGVLVGAVLGCFSIAIAATLASGGGVQRLTAGVFAINALMDFVYGAWVLATPAIGRGWATTVFLMWTIMLAFVTGAALALMISERLRDELDRQASHDPLTDLLNRRGFDLVADKLFSIRSRDMHPFSVLMIDLDHFKRVNDGHGHETGDRVLTHVARTLATHLRAEDVFARWGGEEFIVLMPNCDAEQAVEAAQRLRTALAQHPSTPRVTISIGIATSGGDEGLTGLKRRADGALYEAKAEGRDRAVAAGTATRAVVGSGGLG